MDCGPACLKSLLHNFDIRLSYDQLREACHTDVDGTSIDMLEQLVNECGVEASQQMLPNDALLDLVATLPPSLLVTTLREVGALHFVVLWSRWGKRIQIMDPAMGRRWVKPQDLEPTIYQHTHKLHGDDWLDIIQRGPFIPWLTERLRSLGLGDRAERFLSQQIETLGWRGLCAVDAAARMVRWLVISRRLSIGISSARLFEHFFALAQQQVTTGKQLIPLNYWFALPLRPGKPAMQMRGAVLLVPTGHTASTSVVLPTPTQTARLETLQQPSTSWVSELVALLKPRDVALLVTASVALVFGSFGALAELMIFRASSSLVQRLGVMHQRLGALLAFVVFLFLLLVVDYLTADSSRRLGRQLENRLRLRLLTKIPHLPDSYFRSRLMSDMANRAHSLDQMRHIPALVQEIVRTLLNLLVTVVAICLLQPFLLWPTLLGALLSILVPLLLTRWLFEVETRVQAQNGALSIFYLDALAGVVPLRTHGASQSLVREQQKVLSSWHESAISRQRILIGMNTLQSLFGAVLSIGLVYLSLRQQSSSQGLLLLLFWAQRVPSLGQSLVQSVSSFVPIRSSFERVLEPLHSKEEVVPVVAPVASPEAFPSGVDLKLHDVTVIANGQTILQQLRLHIGAGEHVAIVGRSGAGKSSLLSLLLGIHRASSGEILLDGQPTPPDQLFSLLRPVTAWVDPTVQLWNDTLLSNVQFNAQDMPQHPISQVIAQAELIDVLDRLPQGFQTHLGDNGALVSGGEGQRVRLARALLRRNSRLVLLDEPFRGLDRQRRRALTERVRSMWGTSTLLCVTHDVAETESFDRVLVVHEGNIVEDGSPAFLLARPSRYRQLLEADQRASSTLWAADHWRHLRVDSGQVREAPPEKEPS